MALVFSSVSLEPYDGSRSHKSHNNDTRMLSMVYFHCKTIRNGANITTNFEKSRSKISHFRPQKSEKSPSKSCRDWLLPIINQCLKCFVLSNICWLIVKHNLVSVWNGMKCSYKHILLWQLPTKRFGGLIGQQIKKINCCGLLNNHLSDIFT